MPFIDRLANSWNLLKLSFQFLNKDKSLLAVPIILPFLNIITFGILILIILSTVSIIPEKTEDAYGAIIGYSLLALFFFVMSFVNTFFGAAHSWMVYEVVKGKNTTLKDGLKRAFANLWDVFLFALAMMIIKILSAALRGQKKEGFDAGYYLRSFIAGWIETISTILGKLVLPAMIITEKSFTESVADLKHSVKKWPEILTFELGVNTVMSFITSLIIFPLIVLAILTLPSILGFIFVSLIVLTLIASSILNSFLNATYYTLLYIALVQGKKIKGSKEVFTTQQL